MRSGDRGIIAHGFHRLHGFFGELEDGN